jgi:hypothetical protein
MVPFTPPQYQVGAFNCPLCGAYADQIWSHCTVVRNNGNIQLDELQTAYCRHCTKDTVWYGGTMVYPSSGDAPHPNPDLPDDIRTDYEEARAILSRSARGAAALLRLAIQKLCKHLGEPGKNIDEDIGSLVKKGLLVQVQQALDVVRVVGNESVHPGQIDLRDDPQTATMLFGLVNLIAERMISEPKQVQALFDALPQGKKDGIARRDGATAT